MRKRSALTITLFLAAGQFLTVNLSAQSSASIKLTSYLVAKQSNPYGITLGPDDALWFTEANAKTIGRITATGEITEFGGLTLPPIVITTGSDGALWFGESDSISGLNAIGRMTTAGALTEYSIPTAYPGPSGITSGPDGAIWFTEPGLNAIGRITVSGHYSSFAISSPPYSGPTGITQGPDGALWFTEGTSYSNQYEIGRITTGGAIHLYSLASGTQSFGIALGSDGALWFTEDYVPRIGRITTSGVVTEYPVLSDRPGAFEIAPGPDGALWFTEPGANRVARITTSGGVVEYPLKGEFAGPAGITKGPQGSGMWFADGLSRIGQMPACGLGLNAKYSDGVVTLDFEVGLDLPSLFSATIFPEPNVPYHLFSQPIDATVPPKHLEQTLKFGLPLSGTASINSTLSDGLGNLYCEATEAITFY